VILLIIYAEFCKIGLFAVGGGLATLPFLFAMVGKYDWLPLTNEKIGDFLAIAQSSPGAVGVNMSAEIGFLGGGVPGAFLAPLGLITPAIIIIVIVARILTAFKENKIVAAVFSGLRPAAAGLLAAAGFAAWKLSLYNDAANAWYELVKWREAILFAAFFFLIRKFKKNPVLYIAAAGAVGVVLKM
jgi:chromate transporter